MTTYTDPLREHSFDGIQEFDNRLPNWWLWTFYLACIFPLFYWMHYQVLGTGALPREAYRQEMKAAAERLAAQMATMEITDESLLKLSKEPAVVTEGRKIFTQNCVTCHGPNAGGLVGPNLTDGYWLHGGKPTDIYHTVTNGVVAKGMVAWGPVLGPARIQRVVAYVLSIKNTNVPGGKAPQGEPEN